MSRKPRFVLPGVPQHLVQRGHNREPCFFAPADYQRYLHDFHKAALKNRVQIHAYVLMTNHVHLLVTPETRDAISRTIQYVGRHYVTYVNSQYGRSGTLWEGRHKGSIISSEAYLLACSRYIELNPVRAGMVTAPEDYRWSSYRANAGGESCPLLRYHAIYMALGDSPESRQRAYRELCRAAPGPGQLDAIRSAVQTGTPLGNDRFREQIEAALKRKVGQARRGRPMRRRDEAEG
jgi:putative transposase